MSNRPVLAGALLVTALAAPVAPARAAEISEVIDAADGDDPYDFNVEFFYSRTLRRAKITREFNCNPALTPDTCDPRSTPTEGAVVNTKELRYQRTTHQIMPRVRLGIWHDIELQVDMPVVLSDEQEIRFAGDGGDKNGVAITPENSSIAPGKGPDGKDPQNLFDVPPALPSRAGFGDMQFTLKYSPFNKERDPARSTLTLEVGYKAPTGEVMKGDNEGVGRGVHELILGTSMSRRFRYVDPYARFALNIPFAASGSLFKDYKDAQERIDPGLYGGFDTGMEIIPFEDKARQLKFFIDIGLGATYHAEGRDYSELFDALASARTTCDKNGEQGLTNCAVYNPDSRSEIAGQPTDGITTVEQYMTLRTHLGIGFYASRFLRLGAQVGLDHDTEHFISSADVGKDRDGSGLVEARDDPAGNYDAREQNPTYVSAIDAPGRRLRVEETTVFTATFNAAFLY